MNQSKWVAIVLSVACVAVGCAKSEPTQSETPGRSQPGSDYRSEAPAERAVEEVAPRPETAQTSSEAESTPESETAVTENPKNPDVIYVPTPQPVVDRMLKMAQVRKSDVVYDLGSGDGRILITAAKKYGSRGFGFDVDPQRIAEARKNAKDAGVDDLVTFEQKDIFTVDLTPADVVTLYLLPELNVKLIPQLQQLKRGARIVSHDFDMRGVKPVNHVEMSPPDASRAHEIYLWVAPITPDRT
jgi:SAM-dependent methyltransferase